MSKIWRQFLILASFEKEPTLKDVFQAVNACKFSLGELCDQLKGVKEELLLVRHDLQKTAERTAALEGRISQLEDDLHPLKHEVKIMREWPKGGVTG